MIDVKVSIKRRGSVSPAIEMGMGEYVDFIRGQAELLNIEKYEKPLTRNLKRSHPGLKYPGENPPSNINCHPGPIVEFNSNVSGTKTEKEVVNKIAEELDKGISRAMNIVNKAYKEEL